MGKHLLFLHLENIFEKIRPSLRIAWPSECQTSQSYMVSFPQNEEAGENGSFGRPEYWSPALKSQAQQCITITLRINVGLSRWICENSLISLTELLSSKLWDTVPKKQGKEWSKALISDMWICTCIHITHIHTRTHARTRAQQRNGVGCIESSLLLSNPLPVLVRRKHLVHQLLHHHNFGLQWDPCLGWGDILWSLSHNLVEAEPTLKFSDQAWESWSWCLFAVGKP